MSAPFINEEFLPCERNSGIGDANLNNNYAARFVAGGNLNQGKPEVNLSGSATDADEIVGEILGAIDSETVTIQCKGLLKLRTNMTLANVNSAVGQGVHAVGSGGNVGLVETTGTLGDGFGRNTGGTQEGTQVYIHVYVA